MPTQEATPSCHVVKEATTPLLGSTRVVYDVWVMTKLQSNKRIASKPTLKAAYEAIKPTHRKEYVYILKWVPAHSTPKHIWGCLCGRVHTNDMRKSVRHILRSNR